MLKVGSTYNIEKQNNAVLNPLITDVHLRTAKINKLDKYKSF